MSAGGAKVQDLRVRRTRLLLRKALMELMGAKGFQSITVQDIAERAMVNRATFYDHFVDKYALLEDAIREGFKETLRAAVPDDFKFSVGNLQLVISTMCEFLSQLRRHCLPKDQQILPLVQTQITTLVTEIIISWMNESQPHEPLNRASLELTATITSWAIYGAALYWSQQNPQASLQEFVARALPTITASLGHLAGV